MGKEGDDEENRREGRSLGSEEDTFVAFGRAEGALMFGMNIPFISGGSTYVRPNWPTWILGKICCAMRCHSVFPVKLLAREKERTVA